MGAGVDIKALVIHVVAGDPLYAMGREALHRPGGLLNSNQNQGEFLVGFKF